MYYYNDRLGITEYRETFYDLLLSFFDDEKYIEENKDFFESIILSTFERYENNMTEDYSIRQIVTLFSIYLKTSLKFEK